MKHRITALLLVLCLCAALLPTAFADGATLETSVDLDQLVAHGISLFKHLEAGDKYNSVVNTSVGTVGMGIMGWIGSKALQLLKWACADDPDYCLKVLGEALYTEVVNAPVVIASTKMPAWNYWRYRTFSSEELAATKALLGSEVGIRTQNALARADILTQAQHGWKAGVRTEAALLYYCSAENHYGEGGVKDFMTAVRNALGLGQNSLILSLNIFHRGATAARVSTLTYRTKVYNYLTKTLGLSADAEAGSASPVPFTDMPPIGHWAYDAIVWAYTSTPQVTSGTSATTFSPNATVTRAEAMTFLWAAAGKPAPKTTNSPFVDVSPNSYYYVPVLWAVENRYTAGTSATTFSPNETVTLAQMLTFIWAFSGRPEASSGTNPFSDVTKNDYFYAPVLWAYHANLLVGNEYNGAMLQPHTGCSRAYVVTYLYHKFMSAVR